MLHDLCVNRDHAGGNDRMKQLVPGIKVFGGSIQNVKGCTDEVQNGDRIALGNDISILCLHTPWYIATQSTSSSIMIGLGKLYSPPKFLHIAGLSSLLCCGCLL